MLACDACVEDKAPMLGEAAVVMDPPTGPAEAAEEEEEDEE